MIELNNTSLTPGGSRIHAYENDRIILPLCAKYKVPVIMNSDAHFTTAVGEHGRAEALLKELNFPEELIANYHPEILKNIFLYWKAHSVSNAGTSVRSSLEDMTSQDILVPKVF